MATKVGFQLESSLASKHLTDAIFIKGSYLVVATLAERDSLVVATDTIDGTIVKGSLCYCQEDSKLYQYNGDQWAELVISVSLETIADALENASLDAGEIAE